MKAYIYRIINSINGKKYIGQTIQPLNKRWSEHCRNTSCCKILKFAIQKYGKENFQLSIIEEIEYENKELIKIELNQKEMLYISKENSLVPNGYNVLRGGNSSPGRRWKTPPFLGKKWTAEHKEKFIAAKTGMIYGPKTAEQIKKSADGHKKSIICNETKQIWSSVKECAESFSARPEAIHRVLRGVRKYFRNFTFSYFNSTPIKFSEESKLKLSRIAENQPKITLKSLSKEQINRMKIPIICNETGIRYNSLADAAKLLNMRSSGISKVLNKKCKSSKGLTFSYANNLNVGLYQKGKK